MRVVQTFYVVRQEKMAVVVHLGDINPVRRCFIDGCLNPEPWSYLHLRGGVGIMLLHLIPPALRLWVYGGARRRQGFFQCLTSG